MKVFELLIATLSYGLVYSVDIHYVMTANL